MKSKKLREGSNPATQTQFLLLTPVRYLRNIFKEVYHFYSRISGVKAFVAGFGA